MEKVDAGLPESSREESDVKLVDPERNQGKALF